MQWVMLRLMLALVEAHVAVRFFGELLGEFVNGCLVPSQVSILV